MTPWAIIGVICGLFTFGAVMYRSGRKSAENAAFKAKEKENAKVDEVLRSVSRLSRVDLLMRLREHKK